MATQTARFVAMATKMLTKFGLAGCTLLRPSAAVATVDGKPWKVDVPDMQDDPVVVEGLHVVKLSVAEYQALHEAPLALTNGTTCVLLISAGELGANRVQPQDLIVFGSERLMVLDPGPTEPAGTTIIYTIHARN